jgi:hypothetical protein
VNDSLRTLCLVVDYPRKSPIISLKFETFNNSTAHSYHMIGKLLLSPIFHELSFGIKFISHAIWNHSVISLKKHFYAPWIWFNLEPEQPAVRKTCDCGGNACVVCGLCCDWKMVHGEWEAAPDATCTYHPPSRGFYYHTDYTCMCEEKK